MEVKINREIRNYTESMFFGLSLRQFVFSLLAVGVAVLLYFVLKPYVGTETVSWMCILGAAPFAAMGFVNYNGMTAEQFVWTWLRSEMLEPKQIKFEPVNIYYEALKDASCLQSGCCGGKSRCCGNQGHRSGDESAGCGHRCRRLGRGRGRRGYLPCCLDRLLLLRYFLFKRGYRLRKDDAAGHSGNQHGLPERAGCHQGFR